MATKKTASKKPSPAAKSTAAPKAKPAAKATPKPKLDPASAEHKVAAMALKFIDEASELLGTAITASAETSEKARTSAKKKAHTLLTKGTAQLHKLIG